MAVNKEKFFKMRFTEQELSSAKEKAADAGMPLAALIRAQLVGAKVVAKVDVRAVKVCTQLGGFLNRLYNEGMADPKKTGRVLAALERAVNRLGTK